MKTKYMKTKYMILEADSIEELINTVNQFIDDEGEAWYPIGNVSGNVYGNNFYQAMYQDI